VFAWLSPSRTLLCPLGDSRSRRLDLVEHAYVAGLAGSTNLPTTLGSFQGSFGGGSEDGFVTKIGTSGYEIVSNQVSFPRRAPRASPSHVRPERRSWAADTTSRPRSTYRSFPRYRSTASAISATTSGTCSRRTPMRPVRDKSRWWRSARHHDRIGTP